MNGLSSPAQIESRARRTAERTCAPLLVLLSFLMLLYPLLHATATVRAWDTPSLPQDWPLNLGIALLVGVAGLFLLGAAWRMARRAYGFS
jgi:hypothetical protein